MAIRGGSEAGDTECGPSGCQSQRVDSNDRIRVEQRLADAGVPTRAWPRIGFVYLIEATGTDRVKIGFSRNVQSRLAHLQVASPVPLRLVAAVMGTTWDERALHLRFRFHRLNGEWFTATPAIFEAFGAHRD